MHSHRALERGLRLTRGSTMDTEYDIFEKLPQGGVVWRGSAHGQENALAKMREFGQKSLNEHFVLHVGSKMVVARINHAKTLE
jgi:hypothetical protein